MRVHLGGGQDAGFGAEAIAIFDARSEFDILATDLSMPGMDGLAVIGAIHARRAGLPEMLLTGYAGDAAALAASGAATARFSLLQKPVTERQLLGRVASVLETIQAESTTV